MVNTIRASKNTFSGGLVMDLAPDTTPNTVLTSALNATLVTFNGNEMQLQNDMGNGRVETARLPEGYIPVGTCEFGDIIYIVSYNPLTNKSQIGCFPSPERNISSEEIGSAGQTLSSSDFQEMEEDESGTYILNDKKYTLTGKLKTNSVKKIIYNNKLNPGDKFIIYDKSMKIYGESHISDMGNISHVYGSFPKWLKIHVVAIEDSGKINYLDSTLRWYNEYFIAQSKENNQNIPDIDSYRNLLSSGYSVFQSKISGKLALLVELEKITGFSCTHTIYSKKGTSSKVEFSDYNNDENTKTTVDNIKESNTDISYIAETNNYLTYINFSWETEDSNVNPAAVILTDAKWVGEYRQQGKVKFWQKNDKLIGLVGNGTDYYQSVSYKLPNIQTEGSTEESTEESVKQKKLIEEEKLITITTSTPFYPNDKYYEVSLDTLNYGNYDSFKEGSYNVILAKKLGSINTGTGYSEDALTKLNIKKENDTSGYLMLPVEGKYYINALEKIKDNDGQINFYSKSSSTGKLFKIDSYEIEDYIVNNYFHYPIYKRFLEFTIPTNQKILIQNGEYIDKKPDITNMVYKYTVTPAMPYGLLDEYSITNYIDFSKIGTGSIELNTWKYFVGENSLTLTLGLEAYVEDNMGISEIAIEFIDNQGIAAIYHITGKASYSGQFTEVIPLNGATSKSSLNSLNNYRGTTWNYANGVCVHCGQQLTEYQEGCVTFSTVEKEGDKSKPIIAASKEEGKNYYMNDAGIIYFGMLYLAKITVKYCPKDALDNLDDSNDSRFKTFNRWLWTTTMFNDQYYQVKDFNDLQLTLTYDIGAKYESNKNYFYKKINYVSPETSPIEDSEDIPKYISAQIQVITDSEVNHITEDSGNNTGGGDNSGNNSGDNSGGNSGTNPEEIPVLWTDWTIESSSGTVTLTMSCTVNAKWDANLLHLTSVDGTKTYKQGEHYTVTTGDTNVVIELIDIPNNVESLLLISEEGFGKANKGKDQSPNKELNFKYELNG